MSKYRRYKVTYSHDVYVDAKSPEEALDKAYDRLSDGLCYNDIRANEFNVDGPEDVGEPEEYDDNDEED